MDKIDASLGELAGMRTQQALDYNDQLAELPVGSNEWLNVIKAQSMIHDDVIKYGELDLKQEAENNRKKSSIFGIITGFIGTLGSAAIGWAFYNSRINHNERGDYVDRDVKEGSSNLSRTVNDGFRQITNKFH